MFFYAKLFNKLLTVQSYFLSHLPEWPARIADYDGDRYADPAVKSESGNEWIVMFSSGGYTPVPLTILFK